MKSKGEMGKIIQRARLLNSAEVSAARSKALPKANVRAVEVGLFVDTGAAMLCLTPDLIKSSGLRKTHVREVITGNGLVKRAVYEPVLIQIFDREADMNVEEVPPGTPPLLGYLPLEALDL